MSFMAFFGGGRLCRGWSRLRNSRSRKPRSAKSRASIVVPHEWDDPRIILVDQPQ